MVDVYTSNFARSAQHPGAVSIARWPPRWFGGARFLALAPSAALLGKAKAGELPWDEYQRRYTDEVLAPLDPDATVQALRALVAETPVLLCWCALGKPCHRHLASAWLRSAGYEVAEVGA